MNGQRELTESLLGAFADAAVRRHGPGRPSRHRRSRRERGGSHRAAQHSGAERQRAGALPGDEVAVGGPAGVQAAGRGTACPTSGTRCPDPAIVLTASGRRTATQVLAARREQAALRLDQLSRQQQHELHAVLSSVLASMRGLDVDLDHLCRRCDESCARRGGARSDTADRCFCQRPRRSISPDESTVWCRCGVEHSDPSDLRQRGGGRSVFRSVEH